LEEVALATDAEPETLLVAEEALEATTAAGTVG
jgi:hypothetical protein